MAVFVAVTECARDVEVWAGNELVLLDDTFVELKTLSKEGNTTGGYAALHIPWAVV